MWKVPLFELNYDERENKWRQGGKAQLIFLTCMSSFAILYDKYCVGAGYHEANMG